MPNFRWVAEALEYIAVPSVDVIGHMAVHNAGCRGRASRECSCAGDAMGERRLCRPSPRVRPRPRLAWRRAVPKPNVQQGW